MLIYHPLKDPNHCIYRLLCILSDFDEEQMPIDLLKLLDFYTLFPHLLKQIKLPQVLRASKNMLKHISEPYENLPLPSKLLYDLGPIQNNCIEILACMDFIDKTKLENGLAKLNFSAFDKELSNLISDNEFQKECWYTFLIKELSKVEFYGGNGLKSRTNMMEYRYDSV